MKKNLISLVFICLSFYVSAQSITGQWNGLLKVQKGVELTVVFHIEKTDSGYSAKMDSPDQGVKGIVVNTTDYKDSVLKLDISDLAIQYQGTKINDNTIVGTFKQAGYDFPLVLSKSIVKKEKVSRPQEPIKPYLYYSEEVRFMNDRDRITLAGTLTLPQKDGIYPVVILISGSGAQNRDEELLGHKPFLIIADYLTKNGIGVLRFDDRGVAESEGDFSSATTLDFVSDVKSAVQYLKTRKDVDTRNIGLIGHSEGGMIAPIVVTESDDVAFIVMLAGTGIQGDKLLLMQQRLVGKANGASDEDLEKNGIINREIFDIILNTSDLDDLEHKLESFLGKELTEKPDEMNGVSKNDFIKSQIKQLTSPWMRFFLEYDPAPTLEKLKCPVLALNGEKDLQVPAQVNLEAIQKALERGGNKDVTIRLLPNLNHLFQECETGSPMEYAKIEQTFSPKALEEILFWIKKKIK